MSPKNPTVDELIAAGYSREHAEQFAALGYIPRDKRKLPRRKPGASGHKPTKSNSK